MMTTPGPGASARDRSQVRGGGWLALQTAVYVVAGLATSLPPALVRADSAEFEPVADTTLIEFAPTNNLGAQTFCNAGTAALGSHARNRALFRFQPGSLIPAGARISDAALVLEVTGAPAGGGTYSVFALHRLLQPWGEGTKVNPDSPGLGFEATAGEATWLHRFAQSAQTWASPGGAPGTDFVASASAETPIYGLNDSPYTFGPTPNLAADVQLWLDQPDRNFGWILLTQSETTLQTARRFASREDAQNAPRLLVTYTPPLRISRTVVVDGHLELSFSAEAEALYRIDATADLALATSWSPLTNLPASTTNTEVTFRDRLGISPRFYRVARTSP